MEIELKINDINSHLELMRKFDLKMNDEDKAKAESVDLLWQTLLKLCREKDLSLGNKKEIFAQKTKE